MREKKQMEVGQTEPIDSTSSQRCRFHKQCKKEIKRKQKIGEAHQMAAHRTCGWSGQLLVCCVKPALQLCTALAFPGWK